MGVINYLKELVSRKDKPTRIEYIDSLPEEKKYFKDKSIFRRSEMMERFRTIGMEVEGSNFIGRFVTINYLNATYKFIKANRYGEYKLISLVIR